MKYIYILIDSSDLEKIKKNILIKFFKDLLYIYIIFRAYFYNY